MAIPIVLDLREKVSICNHTFNDQVLEKLFSFNYDNDALQISRLGKRGREKRFIGLLAGAGLLSGVTSLIWSRINYADTQVQMSTLRNEMNTRLGYVEKLILEDRTTNMANFIAIRREIESLGQSIDKRFCEATSNILGLITHYHSMQEFDDIICI